MANAKNIVNPQRVYLWGKYYIRITQSEIVNFIGWINGLREKNEKNVLASEFIIPSVSEHLIVLESLIQGEYSFDSDVEDIDKENECNENAKTYKEKLLFGGHFSSMWSEWINHIQKYEKSIKTNLIYNSCFNPNFVKHIFTYCMQLVHLWSGLILNFVKLDNHPTDSNAPVENWFRIVKYEFLMAN